MSRIRIVIAILALILIGATRMFAGTAIIEEKKEGGGAHGYKTVEEIHDGDYHLLDCSDPGFSDCCWELVPGGRLLGYAQNQIDMGVYSGNYSMVEGTIKYSVAWTALDTWNSRIRETQETVSSVE